MMALFQIEVLAAHNNTGVETADKKISARYNAGVVTVTGSGFDPDTIYIVRVVNIAAKSVITMENAILSIDGSLNMSLVTGALTGHIENDYMVYINRYDGVLSAKCNIGNTGTDIDSDGEPTLIIFTAVLEEAWYYQAVQYAAQNGLMTGTSDTTFEPNAYMTRGMAATVLYKMEGAPDVTGTANFTDVTAGRWYADEVNWAYEKGVISGYGNGKFGPNDNISREQFTAMMRNYARYKGKNITGMADLSSYTDANEISGWAANAVKWAVYSGLITGTSDTTLDPIGNVTRAQTAAILMNWMV